MCVNTYTYVTYIYIYTHTYWDSQVAQDGKDTIGQCRRQKRRGFNPWVRSSPGEGHGNLPQNSCLKNTNGPRSLADYSP